MNSLTNHFIHKNYSLAVIPAGRFFESSEGKRGKVLERLPEDEASLVRWCGGRQDYVFWEEVENMEFRKV